MGDSRKPDSLVREIHRLVQGPARTTLEKACREWLEGRRQAIAEAPPQPEWQGENTPKNRKRYGELWKPREKHLPKLPWPLDGREVDFVGYCADLAIYHDANCPRCERYPLFPMPLASGDLSDEEVKQATYDGASWVLLRDAIAESPDADAMQDALEAVLAELRRRRELPPTDPAPSRGRRVSPEVVEDRQQVAEAWNQYQAFCQKASNRKRATYADFAVWAQDSVPGFPASDAEDVKRMLDAYRKQT